MRKTQKRARNYIKGSSLKYQDAVTSDHVGDGRTGIGDLAPFMGGSGRGAVIRFEMPFKVICLKCDGYIAKGVRFDAERKAVGKYFSTTIYAFLMSCLYCHNPIVIQTDPENTEYLCKVGVRKKVEEFNTADAQTAELGLDHSKKQELLSNPLFKLECIALDGQPPAETSDVTDAGRDIGPAFVHSERVKTSATSSRLDYIAPDGDHTKDRAKDAAEAAAANDKLEELLKINEVNSGDWYLANSALRKRFRSDKKNVKTIPNFDLELVKEDQQDIQEARHITFLSQSKRIRSHFKRILKKESDIFSRPCASSTSGKSSIDDKRKKLQFIKHIDSRLRRYAHHQG